MMMKKIILELLLICGAAIAIAQEGKPAFTNLEDAVSFMVKCLDQGATNRFDAAFVEPRSGSQMHSNVFIGLQQMNKSKPLATLYAGRDFPTNRTAFWLGGHFKELGCINIRFVHTNDVWMLGDTFYCR